MLRSSVVVIAGLLAVVLVEVCLGHGDHGHGNTAGQPGVPPVPADQFQFHDPKVTQDQEHLKEHLKDQINVDKQMSPEEMEFHYFRLHDTNNDTKLDGLEILAALNHMRHMFKVQPHERVGKTETQIAMLEKERSEGALRYFSDIIDRVLVDDDVNQDGYVSYPEYMSARKRDYARYQQQMVQQQQMMQQQQAAQAAQFEQFQQWQQQQQRQHGNTGQQNVQQFQQPPQNTHGQPNVQQFQQIPNNQGQVKSR